MQTMYVYILLCSDESLYTGVTNNLERRLSEHEAGINEGSYTSFRLPVKLIYFEKFNGPIDAIAREKQLKRWSRAKKNALIQQNEQELKEKAKKNFNS